MRRGDTQLVDQRSEIIRVLEHAALASRSLAGAVAPPIVDQDLKGISERGYHRVPVVMITPRPMNEHERLAGATQPVVQLDAIHACHRHRSLLDRVGGASLLSRYSSYAAGANPSNRCAPAAASREAAEVVRRATVPAAVPTGQSCSPELASDRH